MELFRPRMYQKSIYDIQYDHLKERGITCLVFDLDNTLGMLKHKVCPEETKLLIQKLQKDFLVLICSNNTKKRIRPYLEELGINGVCLSFKPTTWGLRRICKKYKIPKNEMCIIGDQMVTDVLAGNRYKIMTILVDPLGEQELHITQMNRRIEKRIINRYQKKGIFERGKYYE